MFHSTELRFPLIGDNIGGVFFHDMGNIYSDINQISFGFRQGSYQNFNYMVQAVGFGIRYKTPVGPVRLDFSYSPNSPRFVGFSGTRDQLLLCNPTKGIFSPRIRLIAWVCRSASILFNSISRWGRRSDAATSPTRVLAPLTMFAAMFAQGETARSSRGHSGQACHLPSTTSCRTCGSRPSSTARRRILAWTRSAKRRSAWSINIWFWKTPPGDTLAPAFRCFTWPALLTSYKGPLCVGSGIPRRARAGADQ